MGREIKRVPLDFDWPVNVIWPGFLLGICGKMEQAFTEDSWRGQQLAAAGFKGFDGLCEACKKFAKLAGLKFFAGCPKTKIDPPKGEGWQLWETVSEGTAMTPVFASAEELAQHMTEVGDPVHGKTSYENNLAFVKAGWAPSMVVTADKGIQSGIDAVADGAHEKGARG